MGKKKRRPLGHELITQERARQVSEEGYDSEHDDNEHARGELAIAAACYAAPVQIYVLKQYADSMHFNDPWPWGAEYDKRPRYDLKKGERPDGGNAKRIRLLVKAGALIAAEIDRLQRLEKR